jgi:hypothetical protein
MLWTNTRASSIRLDRFPDKVRISAKRCRDPLAGCPRRFNWLYSSWSDEWTEIDSDPGLWDELMNWLLIARFDQEPTLEPPVVTTRWVDGKKVVKFVEVRRVADGGTYLLELRTDEKYQAVFRQVGAAFTNTDAFRDLCERLVAFSEVPPLSPERARAACIGTR